MEGFAAYGHTFVSMAVLVLIWAVLSPVSAMKKQRKGAVSGAMPVPDYGSATYRWHRAHANLTETMPFFVAAATGAMLAGVSIPLVNWLSSIFMVSRVAMAFVHIRGIGKPDAGPRTFIYVTGSLCCLILAIATIIKVFSA